MKINLRIVFNDGKEKEVTCNAADMVAFEAKFNTSVASFQNETKFTHLLFLAYTSEFRRKETAKSFEEWLDDVDSVGGSAVDPK